MSRRSNQMSKTLLALSATLFSLVGCQSVSNPVNSTSSTTPMEILAQNSQKAVLAQMSLKTAQAESLKRMQVQQAKFTTDIINSNYIGSPEVLLNSIANHFGYRYLENGPTRTLPIVNFTDRKQTGFETVKDVGVFIDGYANITVDHQNKTILLTYLPR